MEYLFYAVMFLAILMSSCADKPRAAQPDDFDRPESFRLGAAEVYTLESELGVTAPREYKSPIGKHSIRAAERDAAESLGNLDEAARLTDATLSRIVTFAASLLERKGYDADAAALRSEYALKYDGFMSRQELRGIGDHKPLIEWLSKWYAELDERLGPRVMRITNLEHIDILNFTIPVVFNPAGRDGDVWDIVEYREHFAGTRKSYFYPLYQHNGFAGVLTYWLVWGACSSATGGSGLLPFLCAPVSDVSCYYVGKRVAPRISDKVYCRYSPCD